MHPRSPHPQFDPRHKGLFVTPPGRGIESRDAKRAKGSNAGDGSISHPTQTLIDLMTINESKEYFDWIKHLETKCDSSEEFEIRKEKIISHINSENYPKLTEDEKNALKAVAESLYERISNELPKSIDLFKKIDSTLVKGIK